MVPHWVYSIGLKLIRRSLYHNVPVTEKNSICFPKKRRVGSYKATGLVQDKMIRNYNLPWPSSPVSHKISTCHRLPRSSTARTHSTFPRQWFLLIPLFPLTDVQDRVCFRNKWALNLRGLTQQNSCLIHTTSLISSALFPGFTQDLRLTEASPWHCPHDD